jgi:ribosome maturation factor RimP
MTGPQSVYSDLVAIAASVAKAPEFRGVEVLKSVVRRERGSYVLSLIVDCEDGVDTDLCEEISRYLIRRVDELPPPIPNYRVEVASAGLDRPLLTPAHYRRFAGQRIKVITTLRIANRTEFSGAIGHVNEEAVTVADPYAGPTPIPYAAIKRANLIYDPAQDLKKKR